MTRSTHEALLAELLGDVGKLHDEIKILPDSLASSVSAIITVSKEAQAIIEQYTQSQKKIVESWTQEEMRAFRTHLATATQKVAGDALREAAFALSASVQLHEKEMLCKKRSSWLPFIIGLGAGIMGSVFTMLSVGVWYL